MFYSFIYKTLLFHCMFPRIPFVCDEWDEMNWIEDSGIMSRNLCTYSGLESLRNRLRYPEVIWLLIVLHVVFGVASITWIDCENHRSVTNKTECKQQWVISYHSFWRCCSIHFCKPFHQLLQALHNFNFDVIKCVRTEFIEYFKV